MTHERSISIYVKVTVDESKFTEDFLKEFRRYFYPLYTIADHVTHIAQMVARGIYPEIYPGRDTFIEGYGPANEMGITATIEDWEDTT